MKTLKEKITFWEEKAEEYYKEARIKTMEGDTRNQYFFMGMAEGIKFVIRSLEDIIETL